MARTKSGISFEWNKSSARIIADKGFNPAFYKDMGDVFKRHFDKYVPWSSKNKTGYHLARMVQTRPTKTGATIVYSMRYAQRQYETTTYKHDKSVHKLATHHWDQFCWTNEKATISRELNKLRKEHATK